jgi:hypothetical protein
MLPNGMIPCSLVDVHLPVLVESHPSTFSNTENGGSKFLRNDTTT